MKTKTDLAQVAQSILGQTDPTPAELRAQADNLEKHASRRSYSGVEDRDKARLLREKASSIEAAAASHALRHSTRPGRRAIYVGHHFSTSNQPKSKP